MNSLAGIAFADAVRAARALGASDVHLCEGSPPMLRVDGRLEPLGERRLDEKDLCALATELLGGPLERERTVAIDDAPVGRLRVHAFCVDGVPTLAVRLLHAHVPVLEALELPPIVGELCERERGLVLIAGSTGSGKSTTLAGAIDRINRTSSRRIVTIENPVEYRHRQVNSVISQREVGRDTEDLSSALVGVLRCDPDVIAVGEIREGSEIRSALIAAETGHLVFATLHTGDATQSIERVVGAFTGAVQATVRAQLAEVLVAVVAQRLVLRKGGRGRRALVEVLVATDAIRSLIRDGKTYQLRNAIATGRQRGMQLFDQHLEELLASGALAPVWATA